MSRHVVHVYTLSPTLSSLIKAFVEQVQFSVFWCFSSFCISQMLSCSEPPYTQTSFSKVISDKLIPFLTQHHAFYGKEYRVSWMAKTGLLLFHVLLQYCKQLMKI